MVGEAHDLDGVGNPHCVAINCGAEGEHSVQVESGDCVGDAVDQRDLTGHHSRAERQQYPLTLPGGCQRWPPDTDA